ncbi:hypothetical protein EE612_008013, partial [Oryza sativa]
PPVERDIEQAITPLRKELTY